MTGESMKAVEFEAMLRAGLDRRAFLKRSGAAALGAAALGSAASWPALAQR
ncbi:MAG: twin-arginine translocation signal domain-containing protein, partial [Proteobacteria bacterium]|nr:twin-arginine translocation signal domain-containing protein [Pseudomonadota bacterium]